MVSLAQGNTLRKSAFYSGFYLKIIVELNIFLAIGHIFIKDFPQRFLAFRLLKNHPQNTRRTQILFKDSPQDSS